MLDRDIIKNDDESAQMDQEAAGLMGYKLNVKVGKDDGASKKKFVGGREIDEEEQARVETVLKGLI